MLLLWKLMRLPQRPRWPRRLPSSEPLLPPQCWRQQLV